LHLPCIGRGRAILKIRLKRARARTDAVPVRGRDWLWILGAILAACSALAAATMRFDGGDYFHDSAAIDALVRGDMRDFFASQPLMGSLSLFLRAPFVAMDFRGSLSSVYFLGVIPCFATLLALALVLWRRMADRPLAERVAVAGLTAASPFVFRAVNWGHPEELLATALCVGALLAAVRERPVLAGLLLGLAFATKQWALIAAAPALAATPARRPLFVAVAAMTGLAFTLPMLIGDPDRFWLMFEAAGSADPSRTLGLLGEGYPEGRVSPYSVWAPLGSERVVDGRSFLFMDPTLARLSHPLIVAFSLPLTWLAYRRNRGVLTETVAFRLLALVLLARCALDPNDLDYYHVPVIAALAAAAAAGTRRDVVGACAVAAGLSIAFIEPVDNLARLTELAPLRTAGYLGVTVAAGVWLWRGITAPHTRRAGDYGRSPRSQPATG
jgi:hypothetical protein